MSQRMPIDSREPASRIAAEPRRAGAVQKEIARLLGKPARGAPPGTADNEYVEGVGEGPSGLQPMVAIGRVVGTQSDGRPLVRLADGRVQPAAIAASCLLRPEPGDLASLFVHADSAWVTAVLERDTNTPALLDLGSSALAIRAHAISLQADTELRSAAHKLSSHATVSLSVCGDRYAHVAGTDSTQARCTLVKTSGHMGLHAGDASITAEALIKVDAGQVHMC